MDGSIHRRTESRGRAPVLNPDLRLNQFDAGGIPGKFIADIGGRRRFEVSGLVCSLLNLIDGNRDIEEIAKALRITTGRDFSASMVERILDDYLIPNGFVEGNGSDLHESEGPEYLHTRLSLFSQESLRPVTKVLQVLFVKPVFVMLIIFSVIVPPYMLLLSGADIRLIGNVGGLELLAAYVIVFATAFMHELGHSSACVHFGARHGDVGVALYLFFPVLYADVSDVWNLSRGERAVVDVGGIYFQTLCLPVLCLVYAATKSAIVFFSIYATCLTVVTALNPFLRFDGYWLLSDLLGVSNLRKKSIDAINIFRGRNPQRLVQEARRRKIAFPVAAYAGLSVVFFVLLFAQVAFFLEKSVHKAAAAWSVLFERVTGANSSLDPAAVLCAVDAAIPTLLFSIPFFVWAIAGLNYLISPGNRSEKSNRSSQARV